MMTEQEAAATVAKASKTIKLAAEKHSVEISESTKNSTRSEPHEQKYPTTGGLSEWPVETCTQSVSSFESWPSSPGTWDMSPVLEEEEEEDDDEQAVYEPDDTLEVIDCGNAGLGLRCTRDLKQYEVILTEKPLLTFVRDDNIDKIVTENLSEQDRADFFALYDRNCSDKDTNEKPESKTCVGVCVTNSIALDEGLRGVMKLCSRINHSCCPNVGMRFDDGVVVLYALEPLEEGQELLVSYIDQTQTSERRRASLLKRYGFHCACKVCRLDSDALRASDDVRIQLAKMDREIWEAIQSHQLTLALYTATQRIQLLLEQPGLATPMNLLRTEFDAFCACQELASVHNMRYWIDRVMFHAEIAHGRTSKVYAEMVDRQVEVGLQEALESTM